MRSTFTACVGPSLDVTSSDTTVNRRERVFFGYISRVCVGPSFGHCVRYSRQFLLC